MKIHTGLRTLYKYVTFLLHALLRNFACIALLSCRHHAHAQGQRCTERPPAPNSTQLSSPIVTINREKTTFLTSQISSFCRSCWSQWRHFGKNLMVSWLMPIGLAWATPSRITVPTTLNSELTLVLSNEACHLIILLHASATKSSIPWNKHSYTLMTVQLSYEFL